MNRLSAVDYTVFALMLVICGGIGIYHAFVDKQRQTTANYLMANRSMSKLPIAISLLVSFLSAISILGIPSEVYTYGFSYILVCLAFVVILLASAFLFVPVFYELQITSTNEYLEMRFSPGIRLSGCILFILTYTMYLSIALYAPALALEAVSGLSMVVSIVVNGLVCVFYTTLGGLKAVIWTDVFQGLVICVGLISVFVTGTVEVGGFSKVWEINYRMNRTKIFNFDTDPTVRTTFWTLVVGGVFTYLMPWSVSQLSVQRFLASKSLKEAQKAVLMIIPIFTFVAVICCLDGLVIYAVYAECDLAKEGKVSNNDQILPYFVIDKLGHLTGIPGLFIASLFSGCLSTVSSGVNSLSVIVLEDIVKKIIKKDMPDKTTTLVSKLIGIIVGAVIILGAIIMKYINISLLIQLTATIFNVCAGPLLGLFVLGMSTRRANWKGAYVGQLVGLGFIIWIWIGSIFYRPNTYPPPISVKQCVVFNSSRNGVMAENGIIYNNFKEYSNPLAKLYSVSFLYFGAIGTLVTLFTGIIFSYLLETAEDRDKIADDKLLFQIKWPKFKKAPGMENEIDQESIELKGFKRNGVKETIPTGNFVNGGLQES